jgi:TIGR03009 family protein
MLLLLAAGAAFPQAPPWQGSPDQMRAAGPDQPVEPRVPTLQQRSAPEQRPAPEQPPGPPQLTPQDEAQVDRILKLWEQRSAAVKTFDCSFKRWEYDPVFGPADAPRFEDLGSIKYAAPDKGMFQVQQMVQNGKVVAIEPQRAEHWVCDGKAVFQYNHAKKELTEYRLPPDLQGKAIADGPLPFLFGARADKLKQRYFLRIVTPPEVQGQQTWLEAFPRFQQDAANFQRAELRLTNQNMTPFALQLYSPNGKNHTSYQFYEIVINDPLRLLKGDPFHAGTPSGWQKIIREPGTAQASRLPPAGVRQ